MAPLSTEHRISPMLLGFASLLLASVVGVSSGYVLNCTNANATNIANCTGTNATNATNATLSDDWNATNATLSDDSTSDTAFSNSNIRKAVGDWCENATTATLIWGPIQTWDTSLVTDMSYLFAPGYNQTPPSSEAQCDAAGGSGYNYCSDTDTYYCCGVCTGQATCSSNSGLKNCACTYSTIDGACGENSRTFNDNITFWNLSSATTTEGMFWNATFFDQDISGWEVSNVETFEAMFYEAHRFNQAISPWQISTGRKFDSMFYGAASFSQNLCWEIPSNATTYQMFEGSDGGDVTGSDDCYPSPVPTLSHMPTQLYVEATFSLKLAVSSRYDARHLNSSVIYAIAKALPGVSMSDISGYEITHFAVAGEPTPLPTFTSWPTPEYMNYSDDYSYANYSDDDYSNYTNYTRRRLLSTPTTVPTLRPTILPTVTAMPTVSSGIATVSVLVSQPLSSTNYTSAQQWYSAMSTSFDSGVSDGTISEYISDDCNCTKTVSDTFANSSIIGNYPSLYVISITCSVFSFFFFRS